MKPLSGIAVAAKALIAFAPPASAEDWDFILTNNTGKPIRAVEVAAGGTEAWVANKIDSEMTREGPTKPGGRITVHFDKAGSVCRHDLRAIFADGSAATWSGVDLCDNAYVTISLPNGQPTFRAN